MLGLNTKVAQTVAKQLGVPIELVMVKPSDALISPNNFVTGGSTSSERCCNVSIPNSGLYMKGQRTGKIILILLLF